MNQTEWSTGRVSWNNSKTFQEQFKYCKIKISKQIVKIFRAIKPINFMTN